MCEKCPEAASLIRDPETLDGFALLLENVVRRSEPGIASDLFVGIAEVAKGLANDLRGQMASDLLTDLVRRNLENVGRR